MKEVFMVCVQVKWNRQVYQSSPWGKRKTSKRVIVTVNVTCDARAPSGTRNRCSNVTPTVTLAHLFVLRSSSRILEEKRDCSQSNISFDKFSLHLETMSGVRRGAASGSGALACVLDSRKHARTKCLGSTFIQIFDKFTLLNRRDEQIPELKYFLLQKTFFLHLFINNLRYRSMGLSRNTWPSSKNWWRYWFTR